MKYRKLGDTGSEVSEVALGTWAFGSGVYGQVQRDQAVAAVDAAVDAGVTLFDTAPLYGCDGVDGVAETLLGEALRGKRDKVLISTKVGRKHSLAEATCFDREGVVASAEESLRRLQTDTIDIFFLHSPFGPDDIKADIWEGLGRLRDAGKVRWVGHSISLLPQTQGLAREWAQQGKIQVVQTVMNLMNRESTTLIQELGEMGVGVVARECLANGFLTDSVDGQTVFPEGSLNARYTRDEIVERARYAANFDFLKNPQLPTRAQAAMRWVLDTPYVSSVLTGARGEKELLQCAAASDAPRFTPEAMAKAKQFHERDYSAA